MRRLRVLLALPLLAVPLQAAGAITAHADPADVGTVQCSATGGLTTNSGPLPQTVSFTINLTLSCPGAVLDDVGTWTMSMSGQMSPGFCGGGEGLANVTGNGPDGGFNGGVQLAMSGAALNIGGTLGSNDAGGDALQASLTAVPRSGTPCVNTQTTMSLTGQASISDVPPPPDWVACTTFGNENYVPGITTLPGGFAVQGNATLNCVNPTSDDQGPWAVNYIASVFGDCGATEGSLSLNWGAPDGSGTSTTGEYERVGTMLDITAESGDNAMEIWAQLSPIGNCATVPLAGGSYTGFGAIVE